jgi:hypothetical protein
MAARRTRRPPGTAAFAIVAALAGCTTESPAFPPLGNCSPSNEVDAAPCGATVPGRGTGAALPDGSMTGNDAGNVGPMEAGSCGALDSVLASGNIVHPSCVACIAASPCCTGDGVCSAEPACFAIVQCVVGPGCQNAGCVNMCESQNPLGAADYVQFAGCVTLNCPTQCPFLSPVGDP